MASFGGTGLINTNLVFGYDSGNNRFFPGEPTTNLISGEVNNTPKVGNGWGTYNTNQYNGAQYFSIGTISSVSSNIVTTSGNHPLRSYDVVTPQTTGGGVTAGTNYLIKKISNTTFSIHTYNGSQDGSQGYINTSTGTYKVYDDFANDIRVSINATNFPTMWWGPPHLPNSGLVKEIITNGFTNPITGEKSDCIRQHVHRLDGVSDHMAYGVDAGFTPNQTVCCSFWARAVDGRAVGKSINYYHYTYGQTSATAYSMNAELGQIGEWKRYNYTFTSPNSVAISYWFNPGGPYKYDIANIQIEQKNRPTPFTTSSRGNTTSLLDKKRTYALNLSNVSFNSSGEMIFDGVNDYIDTNSNSILSGTQDFTIESVYNMTSQTGGLIFGNYGPSYTTNTIWFSGQYGLYLNVAHYAPGAPIANGRYHMVVTRQSGQIKLYLNNSLVHTGTNTASISNGQNFRIGADVNGAAEPFGGNIYLVRVYNRSMTPSEIDQNYKAYRRRFSLP
jgi:hypothetical protein